MIPKMLCNIYHWKTVQNTYKNPSHTKKSVKIARLQSKILIIAFSWMPIENVNVNVCVFAPINWLQAENNYEWFNC